MIKINQFLKITPLVGLTALCLAFTACTYEEEDLFEQSAAQRLNASAKEYRELLTSSQYGWAMEYWPNNGTMGGYVFTAKFAEDGSVEMCSEEDITYDGKTYTPGDAFTSNYSVKSEQGTILTFDSYNPLFHKFSEPQGSSNVSGYNSDYEFVFMRTSENQDTVYFRGKKYGQEMALTRLGESAGKYMKRITAFNGLYLVGIHKMIVGTEEYRIAFHPKANSNTKSFIVFTSNNSYSWFPNIQTGTDISVSDNHITLHDEITLPDGTIIKSFKIEDNQIISEDGKAYIPIPSLFEQITNPKYPWYIPIRQTVDASNYHYLVTDDMCEMSPVLYELFRESDANYDPNSDIIMQVTNSISLFKDMGFYPATIKNFQGNDYVIDYQYSYYNAVTNQGVSEIYYPVYSNGISFLYAIDSFFFFEVTFGCNLRVNVKQESNNLISFESLGYRHDDIMGNFATCDYDNPDNNIYPTPLKFFSAIVDNSPYRIEPNTQPFTTKIKFISTVDSNIWFYLELKNSIMTPGWLTWV